MAITEVYFLFVLVIIFPAKVSSAPVITAPWGPIAGVDKVSRDNISYYAYYGIPYAKPPVGDLRFRKPVPHPGVSHVFNASAYGPKCLQLTQLSYKNIDNPDMQEDCLTLNVFVPRPHGTPVQRSVMVWIHGGGFAWGDATQYKPWMLVTKADVIVVVIQYRLGIFGFLSTGSDDSPGNYGLWDQHLALKWVKQNIHAFGGKQDDITIIGESAGASSVAFHVLYPGSKGLFTKAILQSGAATSLWTLQRNPTFLAGYIGYTLHCSSNRTTSVVDCLRGKDAKVLAGFGLLGGSMAYDLMAFPFLPVVDGDFIKDDPAKLMTDAQFLNSTVLGDIDVMLGVNNNEGSYLLYNAFAFDKVLNYTFAEQLFQQKSYDNDILTTSAQLSLGDHDTKIDDVIKVAYTYPRPPQSSDLPHDEVFNTYGDPGFVAPAVLFARAHAQISEKNCYFYLFNHYPSFTGDNPIKGIMHGFDTVYLFNLSPRTVRMFGNTGNITQEEYDLSDTFVNFIAEFAKRGDPNAIIEPKLGQRWPTFKNPDGQYLSFTTNMSIESDIYSKRMSLWLETIPYLMHMWKPVATTTPPAISTTQYNPWVSTTTDPSNWFHLDQRTAEVTILSLIIVLVGVGVILLTVIACWCLRQKRSPKQKYAVR